MMLSGPYTPRGIEIFPLLPSLVDEQEERARELEAIGEHRHAAWVRGCSRRRPCKVRLCPACAKREAARRARKVERVMRAMTVPVLTLFTLCSRSKTDLAATLVSIRKQQGLLRRRKCWRGIELAIGSLETKLTDDGERWNVHIHLVVDAAGGFDAAAIRQQWRRLCDGRGDFKVDDFVRSREAVARYITKAQGWCPPPGKLTPALLDVLRHALHGRQLVVEWGWRRFQRQRHLASSKRVTCVMPINVAEVESAEVAAAATAQTCLSEPDE